MLGAPSLPFLGDSGLVEVPFWLPSSVLGCPTFVLREYSRKAEGSCDFRSLVLVCLIRSLALLSLSYAFPARSLLGLLLVLMKTMMESLIREVLQFWSKTPLRKC